MRVLTASSVLLSVAAKGVLRLVGRGVLTPPGREHYHAHALLTPHPGALRTATPYQRLPIGHCCEDEYLTQNFGSAFAK